jgi:glycopeptide antibiotics resistance protein
MRVALAFWYAAWCYVAVPWRSFRPRPSFRNVELLPFAIGSLRGQLLNVLLFVPLGVIGIRLGWSPKTVALVGVGTSVLTELLQLFSTRRYPSTTDVILNTAGVLIGIALARGWTRTVNAMRRESSESDALTSP